MYTHTYTHILHIYVCVSLLLLLVLVLVLVACSRSCLFSFALLFSGKSSESHAEGARPHRRQRYSSVTFGLLSQSRPSCFPYDISFRSELGSPTISQKLWVHIYIYIYTYIYIYIYIYMYTLLGTPSPPA